VELEWSRANLVFVGKAENGGLQKESEAREVESVESDKRKP